MPTYEFTCKQCNNRFDVMVPIADKGKVSCPSCSSQELQEIFGANISKSRSVAKDSSCNDSCPSKRFGFG